jgi:hypothetical protein
MPHSEAAIVEGLFRSGVDVRVGDISELLDGL